MEGNMLKVKFLGTGANGGTPQLDCSCLNCLSGITRRRSSVLVSINKVNLLLDCGPDVNTQLRFVHLKLQDISGIALTHLHWDHSNGLVELSCGKKINVPILAPGELKKELLSNSTLAFLFQSGFAKFQNQIKDIKVDFIKIKHDPKFNTFAIKVAGKNKSLIYAPDVGILDKQLLTKISKVNLVIFDGTFLKESKHHHLAIKESAGKLAKITNNVIFTHINHSEKIEEIVSFVDGLGFKVASDGMELKI